LLRATFIENKKKEKEKRGKEHYQLSSRWRDYFKPTENLNAVSFHIHRPWPLVEMAGRRGVRTRGRAGPSGGRRERERLSSFSGEIRCSISGVVGAVIAEDRLLFPPPPLISPFPSPRVPSPFLPPRGPVLPPTRRPCPYRFTLAPKCPLRKPSSPPPKNLPAPLAYVFPYYVGSSTVSGIIGWPSVLSLSPTAQACGTPSGA